MFTWFEILAPNLKKRQGLPFTAFVCLKLKIPQKVEDEKYQGTKRDIWLILNKFEKWSLKKNGGGTALQILVAQKYQLPWKLQER